MWEQTNAALRVRIGRNAQPSGAIIDSQSVKTTEKEARRLRRREEGERPQAALPGRHRGLATQGRGPFGQCSGPRRRQTTADLHERAVPAAGDAVGGYWLPGEMRDVDPDLAGVDVGGRPALVNGVAHGVGGAWRGTHRLAGAQAALGSGADVRLAGAVSSAEQGL